MSTVTEAGDGPPKPKSGVRGLRGLARKKSGISSLVKENSQGSGIYSGCVKKCFDAIKSNSLSEDVINAIEATKDVEDDMFIQCAKKKSPPTLQIVESAVCVSDENEGEEDCPNLQNTSTEIHNPVTYASPSPPPPPSPPKGKKRRNTRASKTKKKLMSAVESFTKSISDAQTSKDIIHTPEADVCVIDDDYVTVRVSFHGKIQRFTIPSDAPFSTIMSQIASKEDVEDGLIMLVHNDKTLRSDDTPLGINLHIADILECHVHHGLEDSFSQDSFTQNDPDIIELVVQSRGSKRRELINAHKKKPLSLLMDEYARRMNIEVTCIQMFFDGEPVSPSDTPESLDMEEGDMLDVKDTQVLVL